MSNHLVNKRLGFIALALVIASGAIAKDAQSTLQINKFRFQKHSRQSFERLVLEFAKKERTKPTVKVSVDAKTHEATITLAGAPLVGAIPEASINDAYGSKSMYLGHLSVNSDNPNALSFKTTLRDEDTMLDALWLENPARLVLDAFPKSSPRAAGPQVLDGRTVATAAPTKSHGASGAATSTKQRGGFTCFPANAQLNGMVDTDSDSEKMTVRIDSAVIPTSQETMAGISCYPRNAELKANIVYAPGKAEKKAAPIAKDEEVEMKMPPVAAKKAPVMEKPVVKAPAPLIEKPVVKAPLKLDDEEKVVEKAVEKKAVDKFDTAPTKLAPKPLLGNFDTKPTEPAAKKAVGSLEKSALEETDSKLPPSSLERKAGVGSLLPAMTAGDAPKAPAAPAAKAAAKKIDLEEDGAESDIGARMPAKEPKAASNKPTGAGALLPPLK